MAKIIFITGGVVSGLGKGITAASLGRLLKSRGLKVSVLKLDPYLNVDPGTMSPLQHGEVYVTEDGAETDLDLGHYERFIDEDLSRYSNLTTGKVYWSILQRERKGEYLGKTVQVIPHVTEEIKRFIYAAVKNSGPDILLCEIGGTVGDIESQPFLEAARQINLESGQGNTLFIHVTLVPYIAASREHKSKPTQHSVKTLQGLGINPDIIVLRCERKLTEDIFEKISLFCSIDRECIIENRTISSIYEVPMMLHRQHLDDLVCRKFGFNDGTSQFSQWQKKIRTYKHTDEKVVIGLVGKYIKLHDAYLSVAEALTHAGFGCGVNVKIKWIDSETITPLTVQDKLHGCDGIIVPGGFGNRGVEGMIVTARYCRQTDTPYLGICLGMQVAVIDFARNDCAMTDADSREFAPNSPYKVIDFLPDQNDLTDKGGTMRLGSYSCILKENTRIREQYGTNSISERHRHRYEFSNSFRETLQDHGLIISGTSPDGYIVETVETDNTYFIGVQFHPEFKSRPDRPHPLFMGLVRHALQKKTEPEH